MIESQDCLLRDDRHAEVTLEPIIAKRPRRYCLEIYTKVALGLLITALLTGGVVTYFHRIKYPEVHCGKSDVQARPLGCKFDIMDLGWVHPECWD